MPARRPRTGPTAHAPANSSARAGSSPASATDNLRSTSSLSPRDDSGHGTLVASVAAGNSGVSVKVGAQSLGAYAGTAPQSRLAVYKACWTAPDPDHDGCSTADLVTAIDRATADGVDVLNLSVAGGSLFDTVDTALLGAAQSGVFVAAAAGNDARSSYAAHPAPWVTTVGAVTGPIRGGRISMSGLGSLPGAMSSRRTVTARLVSSASIAASGSSRADARICRAGSLDASRAAGKIVICERGGIGRVDKSHTVALADGVGMVLANSHGSDVHADFQQVPTLHLAANAARTLRGWQHSRPGAEVTIRPGAGVGGARSVVRWSAPGDPRGDLVKPDVTAPGVDVLGAVPPSAESSARWNFFSGTSAATARVSGQAAVILARHRDWSPARVQSALMTSARPVTGDPSSLSQGAGRTRLDPALHPGLVYDVDTGDYRRYLSGRLDGRDLNLPSIKVEGPAVIRRTVTNVGRRAMYYSVKARGFTLHRVSITPARDPDPSRREPHLHRHHHRSHPPPGRQRLDHLARRQRDAGSDPGRHLRLTGQRAGSDQSSTLVHAFSNALPAAPTAVIRIAPSEVPTPFVSSSFPNATFLDAYVWMSFAIRVHRRLTSSASAARATAR